jgi:hypothetical protein
MVRWLFANVWFLVNEYQSEAFYGLTRWNYTKPSFTACHICYSLKLTNCFANCIWNYSCFSMFFLSLSMLKEKHCDTFGLHHSNSTRQVFHVFCNLPHISTLYWWTLQPIRIAQKNKKPVFRVILLEYLRTCAILYYTAYYQRPFQL